MGLLPAVISDGADIREIDCQLPEDVTVAAVALRLAELMRLPVVGPDGFPLSYGLVARGGRAFDPETTLGQMRLPNPLRARLVPEFTAARPETDDAGPEEDNPPAPRVAVQLLEEHGLLHDDGLDLKADVRIDAAVHREIEEFAGQDRRTECVGLLLGTVTTECRQRIIHIMAVAPAAEAESDRTTVKMTLQAWESALRIRDEEYPHLRVLGWFHSHAGWGVFLSDSDVFVQKSFFPHPNMVAYVLDPCIGRDGFFYWHNGILGVCPSYGLVGAPEELSHEAHPHKKRKPLKRTFAAVAGSLAACWVLYLGFAQPRISGDKLAPGKPIVSVRQVSPPEKKPRMDAIYTITKRDNLWLICNRIYGDGELAPALARYNGIRNLAGLQVGQKIRLPAKAILKQRNRE